MQSKHDLKTIDDDELLRRLAAFLAGSRTTEADLVAHIGEVDARRLYAREATPSLFAYCTERLHLSEAEACLRIAAARASREHPLILTMLADGRLHLSAIAKLAPHLTPESREVLRCRATHRTKREIDELVAELVPRPDVPASVRKLPAGRFLARPAPTSRTDGLIADGLKAGLRPERVDSHRLNRVGASTDRGGASTDRVSASEAEPRPGAEAAPELDQPRDASRSEIELLWVAAPRPRPAVIEPLAPARYRVQFTAGTGAPARRLRPPCSWTSRLRSRVREPDHGRERPGRVRGLRGP